MGKKSENSDLNPIFNEKTGDLAIDLLTNVAGIEINGNRTAILDGITAINKRPLRHGSRFYHLTEIELRYKTPESGYKEEQSLRVIAKIPRNGGACTDPKTTATTGGVNTFLEPIEEFPSAYVSNLPKGRRKPESKIVYYDSVGKKSLEEVFEETDLRDEKIKIMNGVIDVLAGFQVKARDRHFTLSSEREVDWLYPPVNVTQKILGYFAGLNNLRSIKEIPEDVGKELIKYSQPIIARLQNLEGGFIGHGDDCTTNVRVSEDSDGNRKYHFIDPQLRQVPETYGLSSLLSCPGMNISYYGPVDGSRFNSSDWDSFVERLVLRTNELIMEARGIKSGKIPVISRIFGKSKKGEVDEETIKRSTGELYVGMAHLAMRNFAIVKSMEADLKRGDREILKTWLNERDSLRYSLKVREMPFIVDTAYTRLSGNPQEYGLTSEEGDMIGELRDFYIRSGIINPQTHIKNVPGPPKNDNNSRRDLVRIVGGLGAGYLISGWEK